MHLDRECKDNVSDIFYYITAQLSKDDLVIFGFYSEITVVVAVQFFLILTRI